ncbi:DUF4440 domain-containing protein [Desulfobotulus mexicanus]|uniref:DUF4440 domain-containing protein n=1 Tax=Desulfobotulus mexicanus TaxID=2586642 RepID=A0A5Q4VFH6_9BACT|nr:DUF4440 domain-containing protein [Desulfobotulus mexicanus]TYT75723.1 DUF4440 domain-containing protein [Desulfobotulus mexicanus]
MKYFFVFAAVLAFSGCATFQSQKPHSMEVCKESSQEEIAALFERWNFSLESGEPEKVVENYAAGSILLPTVSNKPRFTVAEKQDYFEHFMEKKPSGKIDLSHIELGCNAAIDSGLYTFTFKETGERVQGRYTFTYRWDGTSWRISSHHSSAMPEKP